MFLQNGNVELTKVHYYDVNQSGRNVQISTISRDEPRRCIQKNTLIKRNIFGHKWVLKINENNENLKKSKTKLLVYILVFVCLIIAVCFGIVLSIESKFFKHDSTSKSTPEQVPTLNTNSSIHRDKLNLSPPYNNTYKNPENKVKENIKLQDNDTIKVQDEASKNITTIKSLCYGCIPNEEICLKIVENESPKCIKIVDKKDPTGCGGLCKINKEYCKLLDEDDVMFQCRILQSKLNCSKGYFNCGNRCISNRMRCDGIFHCSDQSDEKNCDCNLNTHFQCGNLTGCLEQWKKCDGKVDCWDDSDEINCNRACSNNQVSCHNGQCINKENFCDGVYQCPDGSDEPKGCELQEQRGI